MFTRFWDWLDEQGANLIKILYLLYMVTAVAQYFQDGGPSNGNLLNAIFGSYSSWALAIGLSFHAYVTARRVKSAYVNMAMTRETKVANAEAGNAAAAAKNAQEIANYLANFRINLGVLITLLGFDIWNQAQYLALNWHPGEHLLSGPDWLQTMIKAVIIPVLFLSLAFLSPAVKTFHEQIQDEASLFAREVFGVARRQWRRQLRAMRRQGQDVTGLVLELVDDPQARAFLAKVQHYMPGRIHAIAGPQPMQQIELLSPAESGASAHALSNAEAGQPDVIAASAKPDQVVMYTSASAAAPGSSAHMAPAAGAQKFPALEPFAEQPARKSIPANTPAAHADEPPAQPKRNGKKAATATA